MYIQSAMFCIIFVLLTVINECHAQALMREEEKRKQAELQARDAKRRESEEQEKVARRQERGEGRLAEQEAAYRRLQEEEMQRQRLRHLEDRTATLGINAGSRSLSLTDSQSDDSGPVWTMDDYQPTPYSNLSIKPGAPPVDRSTKPSVNHFMSVGQATSNRYGLRDVVVPHAISERFLSLARDNTMRNIETCGILCGSVVSSTCALVMLSLRISINYYSGFVTCVMCDR